MFYHNLVLPAGHNDDLPLRVDCSVSLYADDTLLYQSVDMIDNAVQFQNNIDAIHK